MQVHGANYVADKEPPPPRAEKLGVGNFDHCHLGRGHLVSFREVIHEDGWLQDRMLE